MKVLVAQEIRVSHLGLSVYLNPHEAITDILIHDETANEQSWMTKEELAEILFHGRCMVVVGEQRIPVRRQMSFEGDVYVQSEPVGGDPTEHLFNLPVHYEP